MFYTDYLPTSFIQAFEMIPLHSDSYTHTRKQIIALVYYSAVIYRRQWRNIDRLSHI